jgi:hypothetical protein
MATISLKNAYLCCIGEELINALNDNGRLGIIYKGLTHYILSRQGGALHIPCIKYHDCVRSPITITLYLLKNTADIHLNSIAPLFPLLATPLETA